MNLRARLALAILLSSLALGLALVWLTGRLRDERLDEALREFIQAHLGAGSLDRAEEDPERFLVYAPGPGHPPPTRPGAPGRPPLRPGERPPASEGPRDGPRGRPPFEPGAAPPRPPPPGPSDPRGGPDREPLPPRERPASGPRPGTTGTWMWAYDDRGRSRNPEAPPLDPEIHEALGRGAGSAAGPWDAPHGRGRQVAMRTGRTEGPAAFVLARRLRAPGDAENRILLWGGLALVGGLLAAVWLAAGPVVRRLRRLERHVRESRATGYEEPVPVVGKDEVAAVAAAFNEAGAAVRAHLARVESRERTLRDFVGNTTHDVMIPLTVLQGHLTALQDLAARGAPPDVERVRQALEEVHYVGLIVQNLDTLARLESDDVHLELRRVDLCDLARRAVARHAPIARGRDVALEHAVPSAAVSVRGDVTLLEQAVSNLVHNATRYADRGGHVAVVLETTRDQGRFRLRVLDDGPGIPPEEIPRVTERGYRGHEARTRRPGGAGLGLAIVKDVLARHGFELTLRPVVPRGLEVEISGPMTA